MLLIFSSQKGVPILQKVWKYRMEGAVYKKPIPVYGYNNYVVQLCAYLPHYHSECEQVYSDVLLQ